MWHQNFPLKCVCVCMPISLYFYMCVFSIVVCTNIFLPQHRIQWMNGQKKTQTDQNYVRYNLCACPKQMGTPNTYAHTHIHIRTKNKEQQKYIHAQTHIIPSPSLCARACVYYYYTMLEVNFVFLSLNDNGQCLL